ncbi:Polyadenylate-binding protein RBP47 [Hibiscus syriacus]|uniref:Polyadenylate-binding protein RBP47 n=1 Tax=Hibiscus syriacus TaxID=106335 RepID=A0A6A2WGU7_HIBSY|nr:Polyadenylate-binding protein RBP47 [Hibiscus syriacus]
MQQNSGSDSQAPAQPSQEHNQRQQQPPQSHPQWLAMQYPATAMVMQHQIMQPPHFVAPPLPPQHYMPYHPRNHQFQQHHGNVQQAQQQQQGSNGGGENKTIWVGDLHHWMDENYLHSCFASTGEYGEIVSVKIPVGKGCGFEQFASRNNAEEALQKLNGTIIGKQTVRLSWGRNPAKKQIMQFRADYGNQWGGAYYGGAAYDGYGYALPSPHNPGIYAAAYGAYPFYGSYQQQVN